VATPSGISLSPEGGAHQSINTPLIGMSQPGLTYFEPATADELDTLFSWSLKHLQKPYPEGGSVYFRLSTRPLAQPTRELTPELRVAIAEGAYWHQAPDPSATKVCLVFCGCVLPEAKAAHHLISDALGDQPTNASVALLQVTSPDRLFKLNAKGGKVRELLKGLPRGVPIVTVHDGHPAALSWLGGVVGSPVRSIGVTSFGQSGDIIDLYKHHGLDADNIVKTALEAIKATH
jgi:pyruvate dehydrogenase E1 component